MIEHLLSFMRLDDICTFENGDRSENYPSDSDFVEDGIPFINGGLIENGQVLSDGMNYITAEKYNSLRSGKARFGDILWSIRGSFGKVALCPFEECAIASALVIVRPKENVSPLYLYYMMNTPYFTKQCSYSDNGSVQANLSVDVAKNFLIPWLPESYREQFVNTLMLIDSKIATNKSICITLEAMAKLFYDYWFVQFDFPDENGKPYKSSGGKMVWSEELKREIPAGWTVSRLGKECEILLGGTPDTSKPEYWSGDIPWLNSGEVAFSPVLSAEKTITKEGMNGSATAFAKAGAVVMSITRYIRPSILGIDACFNQSVVAVIPTKIFHTSYLYPLMKSNVERYMKLRTGAQQPHINKKTVEDTMLLCPSVTVLDAYYRRVEELYAKQMIVSKENQQLASLRDFLLPMLMNGQVKINTTKE